MGRSAHRGEKGPKKWAEVPTAEKSPKKWAEVPTADKKGYIWTGTRCTFKYNLDTLLQEAASHTTHYANTLWDLVEVFLDF